MTASTASFTYGPWPAADKARIRQQIGDFPEPHVFEPSVAIPDMCRVCFATRQANKFWHVPEDS